MKKEERINRYGEAAYENQKVLSRQRAERDSEARNRETSRKGGKYYEKKLEYNRTGIQGRRKVVRVTHGHLYRPYKQIIAPDSQIHHEWIPETANYRGVALVEKDQHMHGFIDVIQILEGEITLLTEDEVKTGGMK